jgi:hypothetical protein
MRGALRLAGLTQQNSNNGKIRKEFCSALLI